MKDLADALQLEGPDEFPRGFYEHLAAQQRLGPMPAPHVDRDPAVAVWELIMKGLR